jgi:uncharacterized membrane protein
VVDELTILKSIHVFTAALWVGGGFLLNVAMLLAARSGEPPNMLAAMKLGRAFTFAILPVLAVIVLVTGVWMTEQFYSWDQLWISLGLAGVVVVTAIGMLYLGPRAKRAIAGIEAGQPPPPGRNWVPIVGRINLLLVSAVLVIMVIRPT